MEANELRVDNLVYDRNGEIHAIRDNDFHRFRHPTMDGNPSGFKPIPLTEDILLKAGFETDGYVYSKNGFHIGLFKGGRFIHLPTNQIAVQGREIKFLHELQNGYYWHKNEELPINL